MAAVQHLLFAGCALDHPQRVLYGL